MPNRFVRRAPLRQGQRRKSLWLGLDLASTVVAGNSKVLLLTLNAAGLLLRPFTVVRTRLLLHVESDQVAANEKTRGAMGIMVVSDEAAAAGVGSIPGPGTEFSAPWFVWEPYSTSFLFGTGVGFENSVGRFITVDSKSMRKVGANEDVVVVATNAETAANGILMTIFGRMLVKLH